MLTETQKTDILQLVEDEKIRLGSYSAVARKCKVSEATISQLRKGTYAAEGDDIYMTIALALGHDFDSGKWKIATDVTNFRAVTEVLMDAKQESMWIGISHRAGSGKTAASDVFLSQFKRHGAFKINCKEYGGRAFLLEIAREVGADIPKGYASTNMLIDCIAEAVKKMAHLNPQLTLDQANSLKPSALRTLIHLYNPLEDILGLVAIGSDALETEIKRGVRLNKTGYDELDSRFGRRYIHLLGATKSDTRKICRVNGITDEKIQDEIFNDCNPIHITLEDGKSIKIVEDFRVIKRQVKSRLLQQKHAS